MNIIRVILIFIIVISTSFTLYINDNIWNEDSSEINIYNEKNNNIFLNINKRKQKNTKLKYNKKGKKEKENNKFDIKVSIIIPTYNSEKLIGRCLESALNQTLKEIEILVVDDCSVDSTRSIINKYQKKDDRIKYIYKGKNSGVGISRNLALEEVIGEFVGFIDADDYVDSGWYQNLYDNSKNMDLIRGIRVIHEFSDTYRKIKEKPYGCIVPSIIRKSFLDKYNIRFPKIRKYEDSTFNRIVKSKNPRTILLPDNGIYYHYVKREGSLSNYTNPFKNNSILEAETKVITQSNISITEANEPTSNVNVITNINKVSNNDSIKTIKYLSFSKIIIASIVIIAFIIITVSYYLKKRRDSNIKNGSYEMFEEFNELLNPEQNEFN